MKRFNDWLGLKITNSVGTMYCAYLFAVIGTTGVIGALTGNVKIVLIVGAVSGYFLQLVLLPVILVGQRLQDSKSAQRHKELHKKLDENHQEHMQHIMKIHLNLGQRGKK